MKIELPLKSLAARLAVLLLGVTAAALGVLTAGYGFISGTLTDDRYRPQQGVLEAAVAYFPDNPRMHAMIAQAELAKGERDLQKATRHAQRAAALSPGDYRHHMLLAAVGEAGGDRAAAEAALTEAVRLAPNFTEPRWRLANLLVRQGKLARAVQEFRRVTAQDDLRLPASLDLVWRASGGRVEGVRALAGDNPTSLVALCRFLLKQNRPAEAAAALRALGTEALRADPEARAALQELMGAGRADTAHDMWAAAVGAPPVGLFNGGFEQDPQKDFAQFDWQFSRGNHARVSIDESVAHGGARSLRVEFINRDTTRLGGEVRQVFAVRPGAACRLECHVRAADLVIPPEGPRLVLIAYPSGTPVAQSAPIAPGSRDWQALGVNFVAPKVASGDKAFLQLTLQRTPRYSYDDPSSGVIWLDDFSVSERPAGDAPAK